jgi:hypothetical protein
MPGAYRPTRTATARETDAGAGSTGPGVSRFATGAVPAAGPVPTDSVGSHRSAATVRLPAG